MSIYRSEIAALQDQLNTLNAELEERKDNHRQAGTNMNIIGDLDPTINRLISQIDEVQEAIELLQNWDEGSPNGFHELAEEYDFSDPEQWHNISSSFMPTSNNN